jgi:hydroxyacylglutathione hydrolase/adenylyltransferase/sulfurtransferase
MTADKAANEAPAASEAPIEDELEPARVREMLSGGEAEVVDVRAGYEHDAGHVPGARHVPLERLESEAEGLDRSRPLVLYCRGGERSAMAAEAFRNSGWDAYSMAGGLVAWADTGLPLEPDDGEVAERSKLPGA